jgi:hypothetical protein
LFVAANPGVAGPLELGDECAEIQRELTAVVVRADAPGRTRTRAAGGPDALAMRVENGTAALAAKQVPDEQRPRCVNRDGIDARRVMLRPPARLARRLDS